MRGLRCVQPQMEDRCSDLASGGSSPRGSGEATSAAAPAAAAGMGKKKKSRAPSPVGEGRDAAGTETTTGAWTGEKKTKIQSAPSSGDVDMIERDDETEHSEQIEGLEWDVDRLKKEIDCCLERLRDFPDDDDDDDGGVWTPNDEQQLKALNQRLALYRIRAIEVCNMLLFISDSDVVARSCPAAYFRFACQF